MKSDHSYKLLSRRHFLSFVGAAAAVGRSPWGTEVCYAAEDPILAGRPMVRYPEKTDLILLTSRPPQLETPMKYFEQAITPNDAFFVRYHAFPPPTHVDPATWRLRVTGHVDQPLEMSLDDLKSQFPPTRLVAVNQCSGNSRGRSNPRVFGGQWGDGAMGNAEWIGVRLQDLLRRAGVKAGAVDIAFRGFDTPAAPTIPHFAKSLTLNMLAESPDVMVAYLMNGQSLPMLNGFPARLVVPGWYSTYWVKHLEEITVLDHPFDGFWMVKAYQIPANPCACAVPGVKPAVTVPINRMRVRSFILSPKDGEQVAVGRPVSLKGIAFDGGYGIANVDISADDGNSWRRAELGPDLGPYSFRQWSAAWVPTRRGAFRLLARAANRIGESQPMEAPWNPSGYMRNVIERVLVTAF